MAVRNAKKSRERPVVIAGLVSVLPGIDVDAGRLAALIVEGVNACPAWPMSAEVQALPEMIPTPRSARGSRSPRRVYDYALVLHAADRPRRPSDARLLELARRSARERLRKAYGPRVKVRVGQASDGQTLSVCWYTVIGNPRYGS